MLLSGDWRIDISKSEYRNPKQIQNPNIKCSKLRQLVKTILLDSRFRGNDMFHKSFLFPVVIIAKAGIHID